MAQLLFIKPQKLTQATLIGGNVDTDKYGMCILNTQKRVIEPLLGTELYNKLVVGLTPTEHLMDDGNGNLVTDGTDNIISKLVADGLEGLYHTIFYKYIQPITLYESAADYIAISPYTLNNGGLYKNAPANVEVVSKKEVDYLSERQSAIAQNYINDFKKFMDKYSIEIPEYKTIQDEVDAQNLNVSKTLYFS